METRDFYARLLGVVSPWTVKTVDLDDKSETVNVYLECSLPVEFQYAIGEGGRLISKTQKPLSERIRHNPEVESGGISDKGAWRYAV